MEKVKMSISEAQKMIRLKKEQVQELLEQERRISTTSYLRDENPMESMYDFVKFQKEISEIYETILRIKHSINTFNLNTVLNGFEFTIDVALVRLSILNEQKSRLKKMKTKDALFRRTRPDGTVEFTKLNYDLNDVKQEYDKIDEEIKGIQLSLDSMNMSSYIEVEI